MDIFRFKNRFILYPSAKHVNIPGKIPVKKYNSSASGRIVTESSPLEIRLRRRAGFTLGKIPAFLRTLHQGAKSWAELLPPNNRRPESVYPGRPLKIIPSSVKISPTVPTADPHQLAWTHGRSCRSPNSAECLPKMHPPSWQ